MLPRRTLMYFLSSSVHKKSDVFKSDILEIARQCFYPLAVVRFLLLLTVDSSLLILSSYFFYTFRRLLLLSILHPLSPSSPVPLMSATADEPIWRTGFFPVLSTERQSWLPLFFSLCLLPHQPSSSRSSSSSINRQREAEDNISRLMDGWRQKRDEGMHM